ncbi:MAG: hypothetical protein ACLQNG_07000 [Acidimicrobiales bacterium]
MIVDSAQEQAHEITYFVNGEKQATREHKRQVREILEKAGFLPVHEYELTRDSDGHTYKHYDEEVQLHENERFTATYIGPTPVS